MKFNLLYFTNHSTSNGTVYFLQLKLCTTGLLYIRCSLKSPMFGFANMSTARWRVPEHRADITALSASTPCTRPVSSTTTTASTTATTPVTK